MYYGDEVGINAPSLYSNNNGAVGDPPQPDRPRRRRFTADYKLAILADYDRLIADGTRGALLRREALHTSHIVSGARLGRRGVLHRTGTAPVTSRPATTHAALAKANRNVERLEASWPRRGPALEIMGRAHALLEMLAESADSDLKPKN